MSETGENGVRAGKLTPKRRRHTPADQAEAAHEARIALMEKRWRMGRDLWTGQPLNGKPAKVWQAARLQEEVQLPLAEDDPSDADGSEEMTMEEMTRACAVIEARRLRILLPEKEG